MVCSIFFLQRIEQAGMARHGQFIYYRGTCAVIRKDLDLYDLKNRIILKKQR